MKQTLGKEIPKGLFHKEETIVAWRLHQYLTKLTTEGKYFENSVVKIDYPNEDTLSKFRKEAYESMLLDEGRIVDIRSRANIDYFCHWLCSETFSCRTLKEIIEEIKASKTAFYDGFEEAYTNLCKHFAYKGLKIIDIDLRYPMICMKMCLIKQNQSATSCLI
jgi:hypothetical protein